MPVDNNGKEKQLALFTINNPELDELKKLPKAPTAKTVNTNSFNDLSDSADKLRVSINSDLEKIFGK